MNTVLHTATSRGHANHEWLDAHHSFSFASWYNPERVHFGMLRVLNDDIVKAGFGFGKHPHDNMEIITIPLKGALEHKDNIGGHGIIKRNDIQVMSAGSGIEHSEFNHSKEEDVQLFQLWIFSDRKNVTPRYYGLIDAFRKKTGVPILLNTSFNENEPIVNSPEHALECYLRTSMDMLVLENCVVRRDI